MYLFMPFEHGDKLSDLPRAGLRFFNILYAEENGVPVSALQGRKKCLCPRACVESSLKVLGNGRVAGGIIGSFPTSILLGTQHFLEPTVFHLSGFQQSRCLLAVDLQPDLPLAPRRNS